MVQRVDRKTAPPHGPSGARRPAEEPSGSASFDLCPSKLAIPAQRRGSLRRTPLVSRLRAKQEARFVSVAAPAGYGKTTLLAQWADKDVRPFAWVSLDDADNDPVVLLSYIATALNAVEPVDRRVFRGVAAGGDALWSTAVPRLGSAIASLEAPVVIVLDDVHALTDASALDVVDALALHIPPGSLLVLAGREEAALPLARFRVRGELLEIGPADLALTDSQAGALLADAGVDVSDVEAHALNERAEGWAAGIYLAALSLQAPEGPTALEQFAGDDRFVADYLRSEHLAHLKPVEIEFLMRTSVLDRMTGSFCDAVLGRTDSAKMLAALEHANVFVVALDHHSGWYRYHHLFRDMLRAELERREPELVVELHRRAAAWCVENHLPDWAIDHSSAAGDVDAVAELVAAHALPYYRDGRVATVERWMAAFDEPQLLARYPAVALFGAWVHGLRGRPDDADRWALAVESSDYAGADARRESVAALLVCALPRPALPPRSRHDARRRRDRDRRAQPTEPVDAGRIADARRCSAPRRRDRRGGDDARAGGNGGGRRRRSLRRRGRALRARVARTRARRARRRGGRTRSCAQLRRRREPGDYVVAALFYAAEARLALARGQGARAREALVLAQRLRPMLSRALSWFAVQTTLELAYAHLALNDADGARTLCLEADDLLHRNARPRRARGTDRRSYARSSQRSPSRRPAGPRR